MKTIRAIGILMVGAIILQSCMADMRTAMIKKNKINPENSKKGRDILEKAWEIQGFDKLASHQVYSLHGSDIWRGMMGKMGKPWPDNKSELEFKFEVGTNNSQIAFLDGKRRGELSGLNNGKYYEIKDGKKAEFVKTNKRINFGLPAYHFFFEMVDRLKKAPIIRYAGEKEFRGEMYDLVFCTWVFERPHMGNDQYVAWVNRSTGMMEYSEYSLRNNYLKIPGYKSFYGAIELKDFRNIDGVLVPHEQTVYLNGVKAKKKKHVHQMIVTDFQFDGFDINELYPNAEIGKMEIRN